MREVMKAVPCVEGYDFLYADRFLCARMKEGAFKIIFREGAEKIGQTRVQGCDDFKRHTHGCFFAVVGFSPKLFFVGFDGGEVFRHCQFESDVSVHVAVCKVVYDLAHCPATGAVGKVETTGAQFF